VFGEMYSERAEANFAHRLGKCVRRRNPISSSRGGKREEETTRSPKGVLDLGGKKRKGGRSP